MASRILLCVEPDGGAVAEIKKVFAPYGISVQSIPNGEQAIEWARANNPEAIIVCVEPRKIGYAICNKIKRSPELAKIPLVLTSAEETAQTFEQHKKLKSRADEYVIKPLVAQDLLKKIGSLIALGDPLDQVDDEEIMIADELSVSDSDIVMDERGPATAVVPGFGGGSLEAETDAAFDALQIAHTGPLVVPPPANPMDPLPTPASEWEGERTNAAQSLDFLNLADPAAPAAAAHVGPPVDDFISEVGLAAPSVDDVEHHTPHPVDDGRVAELQSTVKELESQLRAMQTSRSALQEELDEARQKVSTQPLSKEKEVLSLREIINRKERDILDLRDALDAKDRQILDTKDRIRENERSKRDFEDKLLGLEKSLMAAQEKMAALGQDKDRATEREKGLKARLDDALTEIQKAHEEVEGAKKRLQSAEERGRVEIEKQRGDLEARILELQETHHEETGRLADEKVATEESLKSSYEGEIARLKATHAADQEALQKKSSEELRALDDRLVAENSRLRRDGDKALAAAKEEQALQVAAERQAHQTAVEGKERDHKNELLASRKRHEEEQRAAEERRQREGEEAETRRVAELETAETRRRQELQSRDEEHHAKQAELDRRHFDEKTELSERHRLELDQANVRAARAEGELAARTEELAEARRRITRVEGDLDGVRADLRDREVKLTQARDRAAEQETKSAEYEDQILRVFTKLKSDDKVIDRAKRALAVALTLLDERGSGSSTPAAKPPGDESSTA